MTVISWLPCLLLGMAAILYWVWQPFCIGNPGSAFYGICFSCSTVKCTVKCTGNASHIDSGI
ncbi:hypothetical protein DWX59_26030 [Enterocloster aldenensis]|nr:hypothetical protein DWX59_26030 [Enterocloster aldenensis]